VLSVEGVRTYKPARSTYLYALSAQGVTAEDAIMVQSSTEQHTDNIALHCDSIM
jgi:FMN phosphatase YigB (HAD superfamily)